jgi:hypothetical protein
MVRITDDKDCFGPSWGCYVSSHEKGRTHHFTSRLPSPRVQVRVQQKLVVQTGDVFLNLLGRYMLR